MAAAFGGGVFVVVNAVYLFLFALPATNWATRVPIGFALNLSRILPVALLFFVALAGLYAPSCRPSGLDLLRRLCPGPRRLRGVSLSRPDRPPSNLIWPEAAFDLAGEAFLGGGLLLLGADDRARTLGGVERPAHTSVFPDVALVFLQTVVPLDAAGVGLGPARRGSVGAGGKPGGGGRPDRLSGAQQQRRICIMCRVVYQTA